VAHADRTGQSRPPPGSPGQEASTTRKRPVGGGLPVQVDRQVPAERLALAPAPPSAQHCVTAVV